MNRKLKSIDFCQGQQAGEIKPDISVDLMVMYIDLLRGTMSWEWVNDPAKFELSEKIAVLVDMVLYGIGLTGPDKAARESVVSGAVEPDTYYLDYSPFRFRPLLAAKRIGSKPGKTRLDPNGGTQLVTATEAPDLRQTLSDDHIIKLGLILIRIYEAPGPICSRC